MRASQSTTQQVMQHQISIWQTLELRVSEVRSALGIIAVIMPYRLYYLYGLHIS
jgi:hypothetical protein